jgi:hypothetical protein
MLLRPHRVPRPALLAASALLAGSLLGGCGFDYATDRVNTISAGINDRQGTVDVLGAVVIAGQDDSGVFAATLVNKDLETEINLDGLDQTEQVDAAEPAETVEIPPGGQANLFDTGGIDVTGTFGAGAFVDVTLAFDNGQVTTMTIPVVTPCHQYSLDNFPNIELPTQIDPGDGTGEASTESSESTESTDGDHSDAESHNEAIEADPYSCEPLEQVEHGGGEE